MTKSKSIAPIRGPIDNQKKRGVSVAKGALK